jgi:hypothetical protein
VGLHCLANLAYSQADLETASRLLEESVAISGELGGPQSSEALGMLGCVRHLQGQHEAARVLMTKSMEGLRELGGEGLGAVMTWLGRLCLDEGDLEGTRKLLREALLIHQSLGNLVNLAETLESFGALCRPLGSVTAARLWGRAQSLREEVVTRMPEVERGRHERFVAAARSASNDAAAFDHAWKEGRSCTLEEAIRIAMEV